jgi:hypothetical protein
VTRFYALATVLLLSGCGPTAEQDAANCQIKGFDIYRNDRRTDMDGDIAVYTLACMKAKGYEYNPDSGCPEDVKPGDSFTDGRCYLKPAWFDRFVSRKPN